MKREPWFVYKTGDGRFRAAPVTWQGWAVLIGGILLTMAATVTSMVLAGEQPLPLRILAAALPNIVGVGLILLVAYRTGRPSL